MNRRAILCSLLALSASVLLVARARAAGDAPLTPVNMDQLCVTTGSVLASPAQSIRIDAPKVRAVVRQSSGSRVRMRFKFLGTTGKIAPLDDGEARVQLGLKLRALNGCNVVYVMWRALPEQKLVVSVKRNPSMRTHSECGARGYTTLKPNVARAIPALAIGASHTIEAAITSGALVVAIDGVESWRGSIPGELSDFDGPVGLRTDNARLELELWAAGDKTVPVRSCSQVAGILSD